MNPLILSLTIFTLGCLYTWIRWGVQKSISITFYEHENKLLWWVWMLSYSIPIFFAFPHWLIFISVLGIIMVGTAPDFREGGPQEAVHILGAYLAIIASFAYLGFVQGQWYVVGAMVIFTVYAVFKLENKTNWIEVAAFYLTIIGLWIS
jgi:hypothetical protein